MRDQLTLGELIDALGKCADSAYVTFDFAGMVPGHIDSYRGYYEQLAIVPLPPDEGGSSQVSDILARLKSCVGSTYQGYKGGAYRMTRNTPMWVAFRGCTGDTAIVGVRYDSGYESGGYVHIETERHP